MPTEAIYVPRTSSTFERGPDTPIMDAEDAARKDIRKALEKIDGEIAQAQSERMTAPCDRLFFAGKYWGLHVARAFVARVLGEGK